MTTKLWFTTGLLALTAAACIDPRVKDGGPQISNNLLEPGAEIPSIATDAELVAQIQINDGLDDKSLADNAGVIKRSTGKAANATVMYWNFGAAKMSGSFAIASPLYVLADKIGDGMYTPRTDHPKLTDSIPGDAGYSAIRRVLYVPVTDKYAGEVIPTTEALEDAILLGLVEEPVSAGTWVNMVVVPPGTKLELGGSAEPLAASQVIARGFMVDTFTFGGDRGVQPLRNGGIPVGQASLLQTGVATGIPPTLPTSFDSQPVFQYGIPAAPPTMSFNYTPLVTEIQVRLATGVEPATIMDDATLFKRSMTGSISSFYIDTVSTFTITTTVSNRQLQFAEGSP
ncbi:MAG: hypothetical protein AB7O24_12250 [Kofleriaceae bacterium]